MKLILRLILALVLLPTPLVAATAPENTALRQALDAAVPALLVKHKVPSVSIAHVRGGKIDLLVAYGEQAQGVPATPTTLYNVASLTKPIAAETYLRFISGGGAGLDASMSEFWTDPDLAGDARARQLTPRMALSHRTGFANWRRQTDGVLKFRSNPGEKFGYSGEGFEYLHRYLDALSSKPLDELATSLVFGPEGMADTHFGWQAGLSGRIATPSAKGAWLETDKSTTVLAADNIHTTAADYARFLQGIIRGQGVAPALRAEQTRVQSDRRLELCRKVDAKVCPKGAGFGLGWETYVFEDTTVLMHTGNDRGESAMAVVDLGCGDAFVVLTNSNNGVSVAADLLATVGLDPRFVEFLLRSQ